MRDAKTRIRMNVNCSTCLELLSASDDLFSTPCGHVFHSHCILQWFETGKSNCPQCRNRCRESQLQKLFLAESADVSASQADPTLMQNKIDSLTFQLRYSILYSTYCAIAMLLSFGFRLDTYSLFLYLP